MVPIIAIFNTCQYVSQMPTNGHRHQVRSCRGCRDPGIRHACVFFASEVHTVTGILRVRGGILVNAVISDLRTFLACQKCNSCRDWK